ncbi:MAG: nitroreductase [Okeania sp. SIO3C4]|nr:nitroreductase [Okeania sp. SIO3B3]NER08427.1 nitroreductase [Okeania sp. SIO3C4]
MKQITPLDVSSAIQQRRSIRAFKPDPIEPALIRQLINLTVLAPSSSNLQPWRIILVQNPEKKAALTQACFDEEIIASAPITFVFAADINAWQKDMTLMLDLAKQNKAYADEEIKHFKKAIPSFFGRLGDKTRECAVKDATISATHLVLAAESLGLSTCFINGWLEYQVKEVIEASNMPNLAIAVLVAVGYAAEPGKNLGRFPLSANVFIDKFGKGIE